jgi:hypothetical protein
MNFAAWAGAGAEEAAGGTVHSPINAKSFLRRETMESLLKKMNIERPTSNVEWEKMKKQK